MINNVTLLGRLTKDVEISKTTGGTTSAKFTIAVDKRNARTLKEQGKPSASYIPCRAYGQTAETISKWFSKGSEIGITGYLETWMVEREGEQRRFGIDVIVNEFSFTSGTNKPQNASNEPVTWEFEEEPSVSIDDSSLPF